MPQSKKTPVYDLGIKLFGQEVFHKRALERIQLLMLDIIRKHRDGEDMVDKFLLKDLCFMMLEISKKDVYQPHFEHMFLLESRKHYNKEAALIFEAFSAPDYLRRVVNRLVEERERAIMCMDPETLSKIEDVVKATMIEQYKQRVVEKEGSGCAVMLSEWRLDDLRLVFDVLSLVPGAIDPCVDLVLNYCRTQGYEIVKDKDLDEKPLEMVEKLIKLQMDYKMLLDRSFSTKTSDGKLIHSEPFAKAVKTAFDDIVNTNSKLPEYLSLHVDSKLKKGKTQIAESDFDILFDQVIGIFRHLREKDVFETYYKKHLAKRLLGQRSQSDEAEKSFIAKLKQEFGYQFTSKLEGMFKDMRSSREINESYKNYLDMHNKKSEIDMTMQILTTGFWPVQQSFTMTVPKQFESSTRYFNEFYTDTHSGRKLTWQYHMGSADVRANGFEKPYELNVSTIQACLLVLLNENESLSYGDFSKLTSIPAKELKLNLLALTVKSATHEKVLTKDGDAKTLDATTRFSPNNEFKSKLIKVKINPVILKESKEQSQQTQGKIDEERSWLLDATIVRIMKARKALEHRDLVIETTKQLQSRFMPAPDAIKKRIENLIEREYLIRSEESRSKYLYQA